jgi:hypothetical protein
MVGDVLDVVVDGYSWHNEYDLERLHSDAVTVLKPDTPPPTSRDVMKFIMKKWPGLSYERIRFLDDVHPDPKDRARLLSDDALEEFDRCRWFFDVGPRAPLYTEPEIQMNNVYLQSLMRESEHRDVNTPALGVIVAAAIHEGFMPMAPDPDGCIFWLPKSYWSALNKKPLERFRKPAATKAEVV